MQGCPIVTAMSTETSRTRPHPLLACPLSRIGPTAAVAQTGQTSDLSLASCNLHQFHTLSVVPSRDLISERQRPTRLTDTALFTLTTPRRNTRCRLSTTIEAHLQTPLHPPIGIEVSNRAPGDHQLQCEERPEIIHSLSTSPKSVAGPACSTSGILLIRVSTRPPTATKEGRRYQHTTRRSTK